MFELPWSSAVKDAPRIATYVVLTFALVAPAIADCTFIFHTYCPGCANIGGATSFTLGPYSSQEACESANRAGRQRAAAGVSVGPCVQQGVCE
jgi:hypothetical protein